MCRILFFSIAIFKGHVYLKIRAWFCCIRIIEMCTRCVINIRFFLEYKISRIRRFANLLFYSIISLPSSFYSFRRIWFAVRLTRPLLTTPSYKSLTFARRNHDSVLWIYLFIFILSNIDNPNNAAFCSRISLSSSFCSHHPPRGERARKKWKNKRGRRGTS